MRHKTKKKKLVKLNGNYVTKGLTNTEKTK